MLSFSSYGWLTVIAYLGRTLLKTKTPIVGCPDTYRFDPYCRTALGVQRDLPISTLYQSLHRHLATCWHNGIHGHAGAQLFIQLLLVFWLINSVRPEEVRHGHLNDPIKLHNFVT